MTTERSFRAILMVSLHMEVHSVTTFENDFASIEWAPDRESGIEFHRFLLYVTGTVEIPRVRFLYVVLFCNWCGWFDIDNFFIDSIIVHLVILRCVGNKVVFAFRIPKRVFAYEKRDRNACSLAKASIWREIQINLLSMSSFVASPYSSTMFELSSNVSVE